MMMKEEGLEQLNKIYHEEVVIVVDVAATGVNPGGMRGMYPPPTFLGGGMACTNIPPPPPTI